MSDDQATFHGVRAGEPRPSRTCAECKFALFQDAGWSSYTVDGTDFFCMIKAHPADGFDMWYGEDKRLWFGAECSRFEAGNGIHLDVERDGIPNLTPEQWSLYDAWQPE